MNQLVRNDFIRLECFKVLFIKRLYQMACDAWTDVIVWIFVGVVVQRLIGEVGTQFPQTGHKLSLKNSLLKR